MLAIFELGSAGPGLVNYKYICLIRRTKAAALALCAANTDTEHSSLTDGIRRFHISALNVHAAAHFIFFIESFGLLFPGLLLRSHI